MKKLFKTLLVTFGLFGLIGCGEPAPTPYVNKVSIESNVLTLEIGDTFGLNAKAYDKDDKELENIPFIYNSSNKKVCDVTSDGTIVAKASGRSTVTAFCDTNSLKSAVCYVTVAGGDVDITAISLNKKTLDMNTGDSYTLKVSTTPSTDQQLNYSWNSDNEKVAKVVDGTVMALMPGEATITVNYGSLFDRCSVKVTQGQGGPLIIIFDKTELTLSAGTTYKMGYEVSQSVTLTWSSDNDGVATVDQTGLITTYKKGSATITAKNGDVSANCIVTVTDGSLPEEKDLLVNFYLDYNNISTPYATLEWYTGVPITNANKPTDPPQSSDPAFPKFVGWSSHTIIDDLADLWDFEKDVVAAGSYVLDLYGIWLDK